jgi:hypothetical protein
MGFLTDTSVWETGVYQLTITDKVIGGNETSKANIPHLHLNRRVHYLYDAIIAAGTDLPTPVDIKFTGTTETNTFFMDASQDNIGLGKTPDTGYRLDVDGDYSAVKVEATGSTNDAIISATATISATGTPTFKFNDSGSGFSVSNLKTGDIINVSGFTEEGNNGIFIVASPDPTASDIFVSGNSMITEAAGDSITIVKIPVGIVSSASDSGAIINYGAFYQTDGSASGSAAITARQTAQGNIIAYGLFAQAFAQQGSGLYAESYYDGASTNYGVRAYANGETGIAVYGESRNTTGTNYGGRFKSNGASGIGVLGEGAISGRFISGDFNVQGTSDADLIFVDYSQDNIGIGTGSPISSVKFHVDTTFSTAIRGASSTATGVLGVTTSSSTDVHGVSGTANNGASGSSGVLGSSTNSLGIGVIGLVSHASGAVVGVRGQVTASSSTSSKAVEALNSGSGYGVYATGGGSQFAVSGNTAYDNRSDKFMKLNKRDISILDKIRSNPFKVQQWIWEDSNISGFNEFIYPYAQDIKDCFDLTFHDDTVCTVDGIALGGVIELIKEIDELKEEIRLLKEKI